MGTRLWIYSRFSTKVLELHFLQLNSVKFSQGHCHGGDQNPMRKYCRVGGGGGVKVKK